MNDNSICVYDMSTNQRGDLIDMYTHTVRTYIILFGMIRSTVYRKLVTYTIYILEPFTQSFFCLIGHLYLKTVKY